MACVGTLRTFGAPAPLTLDVRPSFMRNLFAVGFGLLPLWLAIGFIAYGYQTMPPNDAGMLLWALVLAIPASVGTTVIALTANALYFDGRGSRTKRASIAALFFFVATASLVLYFTRHIWSS